MKKLAPVLVIVVLYQPLFAGLLAPGEIDDRLIMPNVRVVDRAGRLYIRNESIAFCSQLVV